MTNTIIAASDNVVAWFNKNSSYANREFVVMHDGLPGAGGTGMFKVEEDGTVTVTGAITRSGTVVLEDYTGCSTAVFFKTAGTTKASFNLSGRADFSQGGIRLPILTTDPNTVVSGTEGDLAIFTDGSDFYLVLCEAGTTWSKLIFSSPL